eukprot:TRINITY_DN11424_c0_g1_i1.p1 TRINITY_DN11424_c0_g1~~TRINITY_DN11424_c0_g1_i1.p1  ORF type:complete len:312 (-),score=39.45 TRINITY_DN11424_c0_g1_i1:556-1386(-)
MCIRDRCYLLTTPPSGGSRMCAAGALSSSEHWPQQVSIGLWSVAGITELDRAALEALMGGCAYVPHLLFQKERDLRERDLWAFPPPVSPTMPFGSMPSSEQLGCCEELQRGAVCPALCVSELEAVDGVALGLGLVAGRAALTEGTFLCEYTGLVQAHVHGDPLDDYAYTLPVCDPTIRISASRFGGVGRLLNHSEDPNAELKCVAHDGLIHVVGVATRHIAQGEQVTVHYGAGYWRPSHRRQVVVESQSESQTSLSFVSPGSVISAGPELESRAVK